MPAMKATAKRLAWSMRAITRGIRGNGPAYCLVCKRNVPAFLPYRNGSRGLSPILRDMGIVGSDLDRFRCPSCGSTDRERHLIAYLGVYPVDLFRDAKILHFAPEQHVRDFVTQHQPCEYVLADLFPTDPSIMRMDLTALPTETNYFDLVIANHVLEHVADDALALSEIHRTMRPGGHAILQTPFSPRLSTTLEIAAVRSPDARLQLYGQEDHVRLYGADIVAKFEASGLIACIRKHQDALAGMDPHRYGVNADEPLFLFTKHV
jgi:SAM-dependent methyltransferase